MIQIPDKLKQRGIYFVLLESGGKKPLQNGWQKKKIEFDNQELLNHLETNGNYGVLGGGEKNLLIVDFDNQKVQEEVINKIPETFTVKTGRGMLHKYFTSDKCNSFKIFDEDMNTLADIQGEGKQVVGADSIHPNGNKYEIVDNSDIAFIPYSELKAIMMEYDKKVKKEKIIPEQNKDYVKDDFLDLLKSSISMEDVLSSFGIDTSKNPTNCLFHSSTGGKCLGFNKEVCHCFHCDDGWNIFSFVKQAKNTDFKGALEYLSNLGGFGKEFEESRRTFLESIKQSKEGEKKRIKDECLGFIKDKKWGEATEIIVEYIEENFHIYTTKDDLKSEMWIYKNGIYLPQGKSEIKGIMRDILDKWYSAFIYNQVINKIEPDTFIDNKDFFINSNISEIPLENGILDIFSRELKPFTPKKIFFNKLPVEYNKDAVCLMIDKFLGDVLVSVCLKIIDLKRQ